MQKDSERWFVASHYIGLVAPNMAAERAYQALPAKAFQRTQQCPLTTIGVASIAISNFCGIIL
eukprot:926153-Amphidinium_carterae.1